MTAARTLLGGRYELLDRIGAGGMATVWRARDLRLDRYVAVKLLRPQFAEDPDFVQRFEVEARNAASLAHPNVATVFDTGVDGGRRFIVMELVDGPSVADILRVRGPLPPLQAVDIAAAAARALTAAHRRGLIHRDVKPANILVGRDGRVRLADFGIARALTTSRVTVPGTVLGSIPYLSPEQARGEEATAGGDVFSLGVVLYEMLTRELPWAADGPAALATVRTTAPPMPLSAAGADLPASLGTIVGRALELDPGTRYPSARSFAEALETWARRNAATLPDEPDLADTAALVAGAAAPYAAAGGEDDPLVSGVDGGQAVAGAALARPNPGLSRDHVEPFAADHTPTGPAASDRAAAADDLVVRGRRAGTDAAALRAAAVAGAAAGAVGVAAGAAGTAEADGVAATDGPADATASAVAAGGVPGPARTRTSRVAAAPGAAGVASPIGARAAAASQPEAPMADGVAAPRASRSESPAVGRVTRGPHAPAVAPRHRSDDRDRKPLLIALALLTPIAILALLAVGNMVGGPKGSVLDATASPEAVVLVPAVTTSTTASPTAPATASPTPHPTPRPTPRPTPAPTPRPTTRPAPVPPTAASPAAAVVDFYHAVARHDWKTATALWSPSMQQRYPPQQWLIDRFKYTTRITISRLRTVSVDTAAGTATVAVTIVEYRTVAPSPRTFSGTWDLVYQGGRWLLDQPHF